MQTGLRRLEKHVENARSFFHAHWQRALQIREKLRFNEATFHLLLAGIVGVIGGLTNWLFFFGVHYVMGFALGQTGEVIEIAGKMPPWQRLITPVFGGLAAGAVLYWGFRLTKQQGTTNIVEVVIAGSGRLRLRTGLVKALSSLLSIGTGASIGREGSIAQLTAGIASRIGQAFNWHPYRLRLLVACGAASGIAAAYNAPVAGAVFAAQIVLGNFSMTLFAPLVFASVVATIISRSFFGIKPFYEVPPFDFTRLMQLPWFMVLGLISGFLAAIFLKMLRYSEDTFGKVSLPIYGRLAVGGLCVGVIALAFPEVWGNGSGAINHILHYKFSLSFLIGLFLAKLLATIITVGSGAIGGVFTPTLFLGAALGSLYGNLLRAAQWTTMPTGAFALVGMGSVLAATIHAPLLAMIIIFEISLNYSVMPPLMLACAISTLVARSLHPESIYTEPLRIKGFAAERENQQIGAATQKSVGELMRDPVPPIRETLTLPAIGERFLTCPNNFLPVVDEAGRFVGVVALHDLKEYLNAGSELNSVIAADVMRPPPACLTPNQKLLDVLPILFSSELRNVPVVNNAAEFRLVGAVLKSEALSILSDAIAVSGNGKP